MWAQNVDKEENRTTSAASRATGEECVRQSRAASWTWRKTFKFGAVDWGARSNCRSSRTAQGVVQVCTDRKMSLKFAAEIEKLYLLNLRQVQLGTNVLLIFFMFIFKVWNFNVQFRTFAFSFFCKFQKFVLKPRRGPACPEQELSEKIPVPVHR